MPTLEQEELAELEAMIHTRKVNILRSILSSGEIERMVRGMIEETVGAHVAHALGMKQNAWAREPGPMWERNKSENRWDGRLDLMSPAIKTAAEAILAEITVDFGLTPEDRRSLAATAGQAYKRELHRAVQRDAEEAAKKAALAIAGMM